MSSGTLLAILAMAVGTYATRISGFLIGAWLPREGRVRQALDALPAALLTALIAPAITAGLPELAAGMLTLLAALRLPMLAAVGLGLGCVALLRALA